MKKRVLLGSFGMLVVITFCFLIMASASIAAEFSADVVMKAKGEPEITGMIFVKGDKVRHEMTQEGEKQILIARPDKKVTWMITPEEKTYMEVPLQEGDKTFEEWSPEKEKKAKLLGEETVAGLKCKKYEVQEDGDKVTYSVSSKFPFPLKVEDAETVMEYKNIKEGSVPDSTFELPAGYEKMSMPMPGQGGGQKQ